MDIYIGYTFYTLYFRMSVITPTETEQSPVVVVFHSFISDCTPSSADEIQFTTHSTILLLCIRGINYPKPTDIISHLLKLVLSRSLGILLSLIAICINWKQVVPQEKCHCFAVLLVFSIQSPSFLNVFKYIFKNKCDQCKKT